MHDLGVPPWLWKPSFESNRVSNIRRLRRIASTCQLQCIFITFRAAIGPRAAGSCHVFMEKTRVIWWFTQTSSGVSCKQTQLYHQISCQVPYCPKNPVSCQIKWHSTKFLFEITWHQYSIFLCHSQMISHYHIKFPCYSKSHQYSYAIA